MEVLMLGRPAILDGDARHVSRPGKSSAVLYVAVIADRSRVDSPDDPRPTRTDADVVDDDTFGRAVDDVLDAYADPLARLTT